MSSAPVQPCSHRSKNLGVLIIDEEHDTSYKQDSVPRYHARETAIARALNCGAVVILGSATPSLESCRKTVTGEYEYLALEERIGDRLLPVIRIVDMRKERDEAKNYSIFSIPLKQAMMDRLEQKEQIFLFLNRRGTANYVVCRKCGFVFECLKCSVSLTFHGHSKTLRCHYCDFNVPMPGKCIECQGEIIRFSGFGTQKLEEETQNLFPQARIKRMDRDTMKTRASFEKIYHEMRNREIDILIGTQMITKGHHFPNVTLVGVVYADLSLHIPDFRSSERTFQLLTQVAGRAGRGKVPGTVIVQAHNPDHYVFDHVEQHDYNGFFEKELGLRQQLNYPPFTQLVALEIESETEPEGETAIHHLKEFLSEVRSPIGRCRIAGSFACCDVSDQQPLPLALDSAIPEKRTFAITGHLMPRQPATAQTHQPQNQDYRRCRPNESALAFHSTMLPC